MTAKRELSREELIALLEDCRSMLELWPLHEETTAGSPQPAFKLVERIDQAFSSVGVTEQNAAGQVSPMVTKGSESAEVDSRKVESATSVKDSRVASPAPAAPAETPETLELENIIRLLHQRYWDMGDGLARKAAWALEDLRRLAKQQ